MCSGYTPYRFLRRHLKAAFPSPGSTVREKWSAVACAHAAWGKVCGAVSPRAQGLWSWWRTSRKPGGEKEPFGVQVRLEAPGILSLSHEMQEQNGLVSKPVLLS